MFYSVIVSRACPERYVDEQELLISGFGIALFKSDENPGNYYLGSSFNYLARQAITASKCGKCGVKSVNLISLELSSIFNFCWPHNTGPKV
jgi:hypothetical protein